MSVTPPRFSSAPVRKTWRWLLAIAAAVLLTGSLPALILALWGPSVLGRVLSTYLQTSVIVQGVTGGWWSGVTVHQLTVAEDPTPQAPVLVRVDTLTLNLPLVFLLLSTKPITVRLDTVHIDLRRRQDGQWNLTSLLKALETSTSARPNARAISLRLNRQVAVTLTHGTLRVGEEAELTDLAIGLHMAPRRLTITQAEASLAGCAIALQGEVSLQDLTSDQAVQWRLAGIHLDQLLGPAFQSVTISEATSHFTQQGDGFMLESFVQVPTFALAPGTLGQRQPHLTRVAVTCTLRLGPPFTRLGTEACRLHATEAQLSLRGSALDLGLAPQLTLQVEGSLAGSLVAIEGTVSGAIAWRMSVEGAHLTVDARVHGLHLHHAAATLVQVREGRLHGRLGRERDGTWRGGPLALLSDDLTVTLHQGHLRLSPPETARFEVHTTVRAEGPWLTPMLATAGVAGLVVSGQSEVTLQVAGSPDNPFETMEGKGSVHVAAGSFHNQAFSSGNVMYEVTPGRLHIPQGVLRFETGTAEVHGSFGVPRPFGDSDDQLSVRLHQVSMRFMHQGSTLPSTITLLNGQVTARGIGSGQVHLGIDLQVPKTTRQAQQGGETLTRVELPAFHVTSDVLTAPPWVHWQAGAVRIQGGGVTAELRDVVARRTPNYYDLSGAVDVQASAEVITGLVGGLLPDRLQVSGPVDLAGHSAEHIAVDGSVSPHALTYTGHLRLARVDWDGVLWEKIATRLTVAQGRLTIDDARARMLGGWLRLRPDTFVDLQGPRRDFHLHLAAEQLDLRFETGRRMQLLALVLPIFLLEPNRKEPIRMSGLFDAELHASGTYDGQPGWSQSVNGSGHFRIAHGSVIGSTLISGFVAKALTLPGNLVDQSLKALVDRRGKVLQVIASLLQRAFDFGTLASPIELRAGEVHLANNLTLSAPEFSLVINGSSTLEGGVDYDVHSDLVHRSLFGEVINLAEKIPLLGTVLRHISPFHLIHRHLELSATVQGNVFRRNAAGQPDVHVDVYFVR